MSLAREYNNLMQSNEVAGSKQYGKFVEEYFPVNALVEGYDPVGEKYGVTPEILPDTAKYFSRRGQPWEGPETPEGTYKRVFHYKTYGLPMDRFGDQARVDSMTPAQRIKWWNGNTRHLPKDAQGRTINHLKKVESMRKHLQDPRNEPFRRAWTEQTGNWE